MKIYDCINFFNEHEIFDIRYEILKNSVDYFVIIEGSRKFNGEEKEFNFKHKNYDENKIIYVKINDYDGNIDINKYPSHLDDQSKNRIFDGLYSAKYDDIILISDCDEIPHPKTINKIKKIKNSKIGICYQKMINFNFDYMTMTNWFWLYRWPGTRFMRFQNLVSPKSLRWYHQPRLYDLRNYFKYNIILDKGFHFSSIGNINEITEKYKALMDVHDNELKNKNIFRKKLNEVEFKNMISQKISGEDSMNKKKGYKIKKIDPKNVYDKLFYDVLNKKGLI